MDNTLHRADGQVVGVIQGDIFIQQVRWNHIYRKLNAKGLDYGIYIQARMRAKYWQLVFPDGKILRIPFNKVDKVLIEKTTVVGKQVFVRLEDFNVERPVLQGALLPGKK